MPEPTVSMVLVLGVSMILTNVAPRILNCEYIMYFPFCGMVYTGIYPYKYTSNAIVNVASNISYRWLIDLID
jgi:hypothetical protein